jgi:general secretion pathway protein L
MNTLVVTLGEHTVTFARRFVRRPTALKDIASVVRQSTINGGVVIPASELRAQFQPRRTTVEVRISHDSALSRLVELPGAAQENLREVIGFEMERLTPFKTSDVYYAAHVTGRGTNEKQIEVALVVVPRRVADEALGYLPPEFNEVEREIASIVRDDQHVTLEFSPVSSPRRASPTIHSVLVVANLGLLAAAVGIPLMEQNNVLQALSQELRAARVAARQADEVQNRIDEQRRQVKQLVSAKLTRPASVEVLEEIARRLPDSTWIHRFEIKDETVQVSGTSDAASSLIEAIEGAELLSQTRFASPVTREPGTGRERFHISSQVLSRSPNATPAPGGTAQARTPIQFRSWSRGARGNGAQGS